MTARITPGTRRQTGAINAALVTAAQGAGGTAGPPGLFATLARHRRLFRPWLRFAGRLMPGSTLPRPDAELVILRVATLCHSDYEWAHHERIAPGSGLDPDAVARVRDGAG